MIAVQLNVSCSLAVEPGQLVPVSGGPKGLADLQLLNDARRGPLGAIAVLPRVHFLPVASISAILTLPALLLEPLCNKSPITCSFTGSDHPTVCVIRRY